MTTRDYNEVILISVDLRKDAKWECFSDDGRIARTIGYAFLNDDFIDSKGLAELFLRDKKSDFGAYVALAKQLNGSFAIIINAENTLFACVDRMRSYPLFYSVKDNTFLITDDAHSIKDKLKQDVADPNAVKEFYMSGYTSQDKTLYRDIKQLRAGESLYLESGNQPITQRYYTYYSKDKKHLSINRMIDIYNDVLFRTFQRLLKSVGKRKIVLPLSGGVDSRLVACMLRKLGYGNVTCFSYGVPNNWEANISRKVAERVGYNWIFVPYSRKKWHSVYRSQEWKDFFYSWDNLSSLFSVNEWIAIGELKRNRSIPEDAVFVPGHTGDFISGGHLQYIFGEKKDGITKEGLISDILKKHYGLWPSKLKKAEIRDCLTNGLSKFFGSLPLDSKEDIANAYECWEWQERQSKFIINSVRTYDFWGYEWRLPLWDSEMMDFWSAVPYEMKMEKKLYLSHLKEKDEFRLFGEDLERKKLHKKRIIAGRFRKFVEYFRDITGIYGIHNYFVISFLNAGRRNINSILVRDYMKTLLNRDLSNL